MRPLYSLYIRLAWISVGCFVLAACAKKNAHPFAVMHGGGPRHVYIAGDSGGCPGYWLDDTLYWLSLSAGTANQIVVSGMDIYVAGTGGTGVVGLAGPPAGFTVWMDGAVIKSTDTGLPGLQQSIAIAGDSLYFSDGYYWRNGALVVLPGEGGNSGVRKIFAAGNDIYAVGIDNSGNPVYWKNGQRVIITEGNQAAGYPVAYSIYVSGSDIYVGGLDNFGKWAYWKNGVLNELKTSDNVQYELTAESIFAAGNDVYVVGNYFLPGGRLQPVYWKNGVQVTLPLNGATSGQANDIAVADTTVYVVGQTTDGAVYWKNGVEKVLSPTGTANSIFIQ